MQVYKIAFLFAILLFVGCKEDSDIVELESQYTSLYAILANPDKFDGRELTVFGVFAYAGRDFFLFANLDSFKHGLYADMFSIGLNSDINADLSHESLQAMHGRYVEISGRFRARRPDEIGPTEGVFYGIRKLSLR
jgi:hypothetical protein